jgi:hypothetical protein
LLISACYVPSAPYSITSPDPAVAADAGVINHYDTSTREDSYNKVMDKNARAGVIAAPECDAYAPWCVYFFGIGVQLLTNAHAAQLCFL